MRVLPILSRLALLLLSTGCAVPSLEVTPRYGTFDVKGHFGITGNSGAVPVADLSTAGFSKDSGFVGGRVELDFGAPVITISTQRTAHGGSGVLSNTLNSTGLGTISAGTAVESDMNLGLQQFVATFDVIPTDFIDVGLGLGVTVVDLESSVTSGAKTLNADNTLPIPVLALRTKVDLGDFEVLGMISGLKASIGGDDGTFLDVDVMAQYHIFGWDERLAGSIGIGYRQTRFTVEYSDGGDRVDLDLRFNGPYVALIFGF